MPLITRKNYYEEFTRDFNFLNSFQYLRNTTPLDVKGTIQSTSFSVKM